LGGQREKNGSSKSWYAGGQMEEDLKLYLAGMETRLRAHVDETETRLRAHVDETEMRLGAHVDETETRLRALIEESEDRSRAHTEMVETRLLNEFWKWAKTADARYRQHQAVVGGLDIRVQTIEDRLSDLERRAS
jgi:hypothetical protein